MKRAFSLFLSLLSLIAVIPSCQKAPELTITGPTSIELSADGSSGSITFTANRDWRVSSSDSWVTVSPSSGTASDGTVTVTVRCNANTTYEDRTATVTITMEELSKTVTIRQPANLGIVLPTQAFDLQSGAKTIDVTVQANVDYSVDISANWIKQTGTKALSSKTLTFSIEENTTYDNREGKITLKPKQAGVAEQVISVKQAQKDALNVEKTTYDMPYGGGDIEIKVEANVAFDVTPNVEWIHYKQTKALDNSTVYLSVDENNTYERREGVVEIKQQNGSLSHSIKIEQQPGIGLIVTPDAFSLSNDAQTIEIEVKNNVSFDVIIPGDASDWISLQSNTATKALTTDKVVLLITKNDTYEDREATINIKQRDGSISKSVLIKQSKTTVLSVKQNEYVINIDGGQIEIKVESNVDFTTSSNVDWIQPVNTKGVTESSLLYNIDYNYTDSQREGEILISQVDGDLSQKVSVKQKGIEIALKIETVDPYSVKIECDYSTIPLDKYYLSISFATKDDWDKDQITGHDSTVIKHEKEKDSHYTFFVDYLLPGTEYCIVATAQPDDWYKQTYYSDITSFTTSILPEIIDLGLNVKWRGWNLGANNVIENGDVYAWGEIESKTEYSRQNYKWYDPVYNNSKYGPDLRTLEQEDDAAHVVLGGNWRMPTVDEMEELITNCDIVGVTIEKISGYMLTSKNNGKRIFFRFQRPPAEEDIYQGIDYLNYWTSSWCTTGAHELYIDGTNLISSGTTLGINGDIPYVGQLIRPVVE